MDISVGVDCNEHVLALSEVFEGQNKSIDVLIELEVGENRSGVTNYDQLLELAKFISKTKNVRLKGIFSHEGQAYNVETVAECLEETKKSHRYTVNAAKLLRDAGIEIEVVSVGSTPSLMLAEIEPGVTEIRPGTYILMDAGQGHAISDYSRCAAVVLGTVISKPTPERVILDTGKALTAQTGNKGICQIPGLGLLKDFGIRLSGV